MESTPNYFESLQLDSFSQLELCERTKCPNCGSYRKYFCYDCCIGLVEGFPRLDLPLKAIILKCKKESRSKSSVVVVKVICPDTSEIIDCLGEDDSIPEFPEGTCLLFPGPESKGFEEMSHEELAGINSFVFIDSTWHQTKSMMRNKNVEKLRMARLKNHTTAFWRYQNESKNSLATVEAVYWAYVDYHREMRNRGMIAEEYQGQYDNLLWHFCFTYKRIQEEYNDKRHKGKNFRRIPGYIKKKQEETE